MSRALLLLVLSPRYWCIRLRLFLLISLLRGYAALRVLQLFDVLDYGVSRYFESAMSSVLSTVPAVRIKGAGVLFEEDAVEVAFASSLSRNGFIKCGGFVSL